VSAAAFAERLWPAPWIWAAVAVVAVLAGLVVAPLSGTAAVLTAVVVGALLAVALVRGTPLVAVAGVTLIAGRAKVPVRLLGQVEVLDAEQMRHARGPGLDARAYLCMRGWVATGVRVGMADPADPTPYWLVSSRRPEVLAGAITAARAARG
jgi:hypothetical protein